MNDMQDISNKLDRIEQLGYHQLENGSQPFGSGSIHGVQ